MINKMKTLYKNSNLEVGYLYFYIHLITEILCFFCLARIVGDSIILWIMPLIYDVFAFAPQSLIGYLGDKYPKINFGIIGVFLLVLGLITNFTNTLPGAYTELIILSLGNASLHISGAEATLRTSNGKLSLSAIFVGGGSFGVILGKIIASTKCSFWLMAILGLTMIPFILLADTYKKETDSCQNFDYHNNKMNPRLLVLLAVIIVIVRGYMGYGIPTSWNKTLIQTILLYFTMGIGKALGGILSDIFGMRKVALISIVGAIPFMLFGNKLMFISLFGILLFSMTMSITLGLLVSVLKKTPGLAFGLTTIGLLLGTLPIFFIQIHSFLLNCIIIIFLSVMCFFIARQIIRKEKN